MLSSGSRRRAHAARQQRQQVDYLSTAVERGAGRGGTGVPVLVQVVRTTARDGRGACARAGAGGRARGLHPGDDNVKSGSADHFSWQHACVTTQVHVLLLSRGGGVGVLDEKSR